MARAKRSFLILLAVAILVSLCGCGKKAAPAPAPAQAAPAPAPTTTPTSEPATATPEPTPDPTPTVEVEWQTSTCQWEDSSGYTFEATIKISPWINTKNEAYVTAAWNEVGKDNALPSDDSKMWGNVFGYNAGYRFVENVTDVYYCIGTITIKNLTTGWDITASSPIESTPLFISPCQPETDPTAYLYDLSTTLENHLVSSTIGKIFYTNKEDKYSTWARINPKYTSNKWGPVPFVFAHFESKAPAYPEGKYISEITDTFFCINFNSNFIENKEMSELTMIKINVIEQD